MSIGNLRSMGYMVKGGMWCPNCETRIAAQAETKDIWDKLMPWPEAMDWICPQCGGKAKRLPRDSNNRALYRFIKMRCGMIGDARKRRGEFFAGFPISRLLDDTAEEWIECGTCSNVQPHLNHQGLEEQQCLLCRLSFSSGRWSTKWVRTQPPADPQAYYESVEYEYLCRRISTNIDTVCFYCAKRPDSINVCRHCSAAQPLHHMLNHETAGSNFNLLEFPPVVYEASMNDVIPVVYDPERHGDGSEEVYFKDDETREYYLKQNPEGTGQSAVSLTADLERLVTLRDQGMLTPEQFEAAKNRLLGI